MSRLARARERLLAILEPAVAEPESNRGLS